MARAEGNKDTFTKETEQTRDDGGYGIRDMHAPAAISACRRLVYEGNQLWPRRGFFVASSDEQAGKMPGFG